MRGTWKGTVRISPKDVVKCKFSNYLWRLLKVAFFEFFCRSLTFKPVLPFFRAGKKIGATAVFPPSVINVTWWEICFPCVRWRCRKKGSLLFIQFLWKLSICKKKALSLGLFWQGYYCSHKMYEYPCLSKIVLLCSHDQNTI